MPAYKNFWSLNTDEAVVIGLLRNATPKNVEVFFPANAQMKDIDLILLNLTNNNSVKIQVKGSRAYEPGPKQTIKYGAGSAGWFFFDKDVILKSTADYFIFLIYVLEEKEKLGRRIITPHTLTIPTKKLAKLCTKYKTPGQGGKYNFFFWVNPEKNESFDFKDTVFSTTEFLDKRGFEGLTRGI